MQKPTPITSSSTISSLGGNKYRLFWSLECLNGQLEDKLVAYMPAFKEAYISCRIIIDWRNWTHWLVRWTTNNVSLSMRHPLWTKHRKTKHSRSKTDWLYNMGYKFKLKRRVVVSVGLRFENSYLLTAKRLSNWRYHRLSVAYSVRFQDKTAYCS